MDKIDKQIIRILQKNADLPLSEISKKVGLSTTPCWNRIRKLEEDSVILSRSVSINRYAVELPVMVFLSIFIGALIIFVCGIAHLSSFIGLEKSINAGLYPFIYSELLKIALAISLTYLLIKKN